MRKQIKFPITSPQNLQQPKIINTSMIQNPDLTDRVLLNSVMTTHKSKKHSVEQNKLQPTPKSARLTDKQFYQKKNFLKYIKQNEPIAFPVHKSL